MIEPGLLCLFKMGSVSEIRIDDWEYLLDEAEDHRVIERVAFLARNAPERQIPSDIRLYLEKIYSRNLMKNLWFMEETEAILSGLAGVGVRSMVLKGVPLAQRLYGDPGARGSDDIDLLVEEDRLTDAVRVLIQKGYKYHNQGDDVILWSRGPLTHHIRMKKNTPLGICNVELHFHLTDTGAREIRMSEFWARAATVTVGKTAAYDLAPADLLFYLCIHSAKHGFAALRYILDIADTLKAESERIDWVDFIDMVRKYGACSRVYASLNYAVSLMGVSVPDFVLKELSPPGYIRLHLLRQCPPGQLPLGLGPVTLLLLKYEGLCMYILDIWQRLFIPVVKLRLICHIYQIDTSSGLWLYYPKRWCYFLRKIIPRCFSGTTFS